jgi:hypothetical protein
MLTETREVRAIKPVRYSRKVSDGGGAVPDGDAEGRTVLAVRLPFCAKALGIYPDVSLERARSRHEFARNLLAQGLDPSALKAALGKHTFAATMREWEIARGDMSALPLRSHARNRADQAAC